MRNRLLFGTALLAAVPLVLTGCGASSSTSSSTGSAPEASVSAPVTSGAAAATVQLSVAIAGGTVTPAATNVAVPVGSPVELTVTSDVADVIHVHGYDLEQAVSPGAPVTFDFTADQTGTFEVETHESGLLLLKLVVS